MKKHVYSFGGGTADGDGKMKDTLGGKGAGLAEMSRANVPVPPGFTISTEVCNIYFQNNNQVPAEIDAADGRGADDAGRAHGAEARRRRKPAAGQRALRREVLHARHDGHHPQPRPERRDREGAGRQERQSALRARTATAASSRCSATWCWTSRSTISTHIFDGRKKKVERQARYRPDRGRPEGRSSSSYKKLVQKKTGKRVPAGCHGAARHGARDAVFRSWFNDRANHYRKMNRIPDDLGTAVNVQAMVFGNLGDTSATGVGFTRNPVHRREGVLRRVPDQRAGRRRGGRHPHAAADLASWKTGMPAVYNQLREITTQPGKALSRHAGFRVHRAGRQALHAADPQRQAHRSGGGADRGRHGGRRPDQQAGSHAARGSAAARSASAPGARSAVEEDARR